MKINKKTKLAISAKNPVNAAKLAKIKKNAATVKQGAKNAKPAKAAKAVEAVKLTGTSVAVLRGERGQLCRLVQTGKNSAGQTVVCAVQDNSGLNIPQAERIQCVIEKGVLTGHRDGLLQLGGYVNRRRSGAKIELLTDKQFTAKARKGTVKWREDDSKAVSCLYMGDHSQKGICAVRVEYKPGHPFYWQIELDSNVNNVHERGSLVPAK